MKDAYESLRAENAMMEHDNRLLQAEIRRLTGENETLKNELCFRCGNYKEAHKGSCDWCRWRNKGNG